MKRYSAYLFDLDGVLYRGHTPIPGAVEAVNSLNGVAFLTNNSALHREDVAAKLQAMGYNATTKQVVTSGYVAARGMVKRGVKTVFLVGEAGLRREIEEQGLTVRDEPPAEAVIVGRDTGFTFEKLVLAHAAVRAGAEFFASNRDVTYPMEHGLEPGAGALVAAVEACVERPPIVFGKPEPEIAELALADMSVSKSEAIMVGDRLDTDIECARRMGMDYALVLTGVTSAEQAAVLPRDRVIASLAELL